MAFYLTSRWGADESEPTVNRMREVLAELDVDDIEHQSVSVRHESEWCLGAYPGGLLVWENLEGDAEPRHLNNVSPERILDLWQLLSRGQMDEIEAEPWLPGYEDAIK